MDHLKHHNLKLPQRPARTHRPTELNTTTITELYHQLDMSLTDVAKQLGVSKRTIAHYMETHGIERRTNTHQLDTEQLTNNDEIALNQYLDNSRQHIILDVSKQWSQVEISNQGVQLRTKNAFPSDPAEVQKPRLIRGSGLRAERCLNLRGEFGQPPF